MIRRSPASNDVDIGIGFNENQPRRDNDLLSYGITPFYT